MLRSRYERILMIFEFKHKKDFGIDRFYPMSENAIMLLKLMNRASLTLSQAKMMQEASWPICVVAVGNPLELSESESV